MGQNQSSDRYGDHFNRTESVRYENRLKSNAISNQQENQHSVITKLNNLYLQDDKSENCQPAHSKKEFDGAAKSRSTEATTKFAKQQNQYSTEKKSTYNTFQSNKNPPKQKSTQNENESKVNTKTYYNTNRRQHNSRGGFVNQRQSFQGRHYQQQRQNHGNHSTEHDQRKITVHLKVEQESEQETASQNTNSHEIPPLFSGGHGFQRPVEQQNQPQNFNSIYGAPPPLMGYNYQTAPPPMGYNYQTPPPLMGYNYHTPPAPPPQQPPPMQSYYGYQPAYSGPNPNCGAPSGYQHPYYGNQNQNYAPRQSSNRNYRASRGQKHNQGFKRGKCNNNRGRSCGNKKQNEKNITSESEDESTSE